METAVAVTSVCLHHLGQCGWSTVWSPVLSRMCEVPCRLSTVSCRCRCSLYLGRCRGSGLGGPVWWVPCGSYPVGVQFVGPLWGSPVGVPCWTYHAGAPPYGVTFMETTVAVTSVCLHHSDQCGWSTVWSPVVGSMCEVSCIVPLYGSPVSGLL
jgi:hypothetical protein